MDRRQAHLIHFVLIALAIALTYFNTINAPFEFDDQQNIKENPSITSFSYFAEPSKAKRYVLYNKYPDLINRYVGFLTFAADYAVHGLDVRGFHITNLSIHLATSLVIYWLVLLIFRTPFMARSSIHRYSLNTALFASLLFAVHPVQTEAITYIVQRFASLATLFYVLALASYVRARLTEGSRKRAVFYLISFASALLGMKTKATVFTLPLAITFFEWAFLNGTLKKRITYLAPLLLTLLVIPLTRLWLANGDIGSTATITEVNMPRLLYLETELRVMVTYLRLLALPVNQNLLYVYPVYDSVPSPGAIASFLLLTCIFLVGIHLYRRSARSEPSMRVIASSIFFFFLSLAVESTLIPLHPIYEHRLYLPLTFISIGAATGAFMLINRLRTRNARIILVAALALTILSFGAATYARNQIWTSSITLWEDTGEKSPQELRTHMNLGNAYMDANRYEDAMRQYQAALEFQMPYYHTKPTVHYYADAYHNMGVIYDTYFRNSEKAEAAYLKALSLNNSNILTLGNLGTLYHKMGDAPKAESYYRATIEKQPYYVPALMNLANLYIMRNNYDEAISLLQRVLQVNAHHPKANYNIALAFRAKGNGKRAIQHFEEALREKPDYFQAAAALGETYEKQQQMDRAIRSLEYALSIASNGDNIGRAYYHLGLIYASTGQPDIAINYLNRALTQYPGNKDIIQKIKELQDTSSQE